MAEPTSGVCVPIERIPELFADAEKEYLIKLRLKGATDKHIGAAHKMFREVFANFVHKVSVEVEPDVTDEQLEMLKAVAT